MGGVALACSQLPGGDGHNRRGTGIAQDGGDSSLFQPQIRAGGPSAPLSSSEPQIPVSDQNSPLVHLPLSFLPGHKPWREKRVIVFTNRQESISSSNVSQPQNELTCQVNKQPVRDTKNAQTKGLKIKTNAESTEQRDGSIQKRLL